MSALQEYITSTQSVIENTDIEWRLFVKDHRDRILENSVVMTLNNNDSSYYEYRLRDLLIAHGIKPELRWIVLWINQLYSEMEFHDIHTLYIPSYKQIKEYYDQYKIIRSELKKTT